MNKKNILYLKSDADKIIEVLFKISDAVTNTHDLDELYEVIHKNLGAILMVDNFYIALFHENKNSITFPYYVDEHDDCPIEIFNFSDITSLTGMVIKAKKSLMLYWQDIIEFSNELEQQALGTIPEIWLGSPLIIEDKVIGAVVIQNYDSAITYTKRDLDLLNSISQYIALAIERKESNKKLEAQRALLAKLVDSSPVGICLVENRTFKWVNNEMLELFGYEKKEDFEKCDVRMIYKSETDYKNAGKIILNDLKRKGKSDFDFELKKKDNTSFNAHVIITGSAADNPVESTIVIIADISQRKIAQQEKYEKERLQGVLEMAGAVCHEINQPLQAILGYSELLMLSSQSDILKDNKLVSIKNQADRIGEITKKLSNITHYCTIEYPGKIRIVDIWGSQHINKPVD